MCVCLLFGDQGMSSSEGARRNTYCLPQFTCLTDPTTLCSPKASTRKASALYHDLPWMIPQASWCQQTGMFLSCLGKAPLVLANSEVEGIHMTLRGLPQIVSCYNFPQSWREELKCLFSAQQGREELSLFFCQSHLQPDRTMNTLRWEVESTVEIFLLKLASPIYALQSTIPLENLKMEACRSHFTKKWSLREVRHFLQVTFVVRGRICYN